MLQYQKFPKVQLGSRTFEHYQWRIYFQHHNNTLSYPQTQPKLRPVIQCVHITLFQWIFLLFQRSFQNSSTIHHYDALFFSGIPRIIIIDSAITNSATLLIFEYSALKTGIPSFLDTVKST